MSPKGEEWLVVSVQSCERRRGAVVSACRSDLQDRSFLMRVHVSLIRKLSTTGSGSSAHGSD